MPVRRSDHGPVLRIFLKYRLKIRHVFVDQIFQRNDDPLFCVAEKIIIVHARREQSVRKISKLRKSKIFLVCELVVHKTGPVYMYICLFLQPLEDQFIIGLLGCRCRSAGDKGQFFRLLQRKCDILYRRIRIQVCSLRGSAAASEKGQG